LIQFKDRCRLERNAALTELSWITSPSNAFSLHTSQQARWLAPSPSPDLSEAFPRTDLTSSIVRSLYPVVVFTLDFHASNTMIFPLRLVFGSFCRTLFQGRQGRLGLMTPVSRCHLNPQMISQYMDERATSTSTTCNSESLCQLGILQRLKHCKRWCTFGIIATRITKLVRVALPPHLRSQTCIGINSDLLSFQRLTYKRLLHGTSTTSV
jgi:hypothetical protein